MGFLTLLIYIFLIGEWVFGKKSVSKKNYHGNGFYVGTGIFNLLFGTSGMQLFNNFLRDTDLISKLAFWVGFVGFALMMLLGTFFIYKALTPNKG